MDFQYEIRKKVEDYANARPRPGFEVHYLMKAQDILRLGLLPNYYWQEYVGEKKSQTNPLPQTVHRIGQRERKKHKN